MRQMDLPQRRHGRERDGGAKRHEEREQSQTESHCNPPAGNEQTRLLPTFPKMIVSWSQLIRERSHTRTHETGSDYDVSVFCGTHMVTGGISPSSQSCSSASADQASAIR